MLVSSLPFSHVSVNLIQPKLKFSDVMVYSSLSKFFDKLLQFTVNVDKVIFLHNCWCKLLTSESV